MSGQDLLLAYLHGLKPMVQTPIILASPADMQNALILMDAGVSSMWFANNLSY